MPTLTIEVSDATLAELQHEAADTGRTPEAVAADRLSRDEARQLDDVLERAGTRAGDGRERLPMRDVFDRLGARFDGTRRG